MLADTSVLRAFAISGQMRLLHVFEPLRTTRRVLGEIERSGKGEVEVPVAEAVKAGWVVAAKERPHADSVRRIAARDAGALSQTDIELLALALESAEPLLIHDRRAIQVGEAEGVECVDLAGILEALKGAGHLPGRASMLEALFLFESMDGQKFAPPVRDRLLRY